MVLVDYLPSSLVVPQAHDFLCYPGKGSMEMVERKEQKNTDGDKCKENHSVSLLLFHCVLLHLL